MAKKNHNAGYVPINRRFFEHPFWSEEREYSKAEAWLDLVQAARFEDSRATELIRGRLVFWTKGQLRASVRFLAERWKWSKSKTDRFLELLETQQMITRAQMNGETIITLTNYEIYNQKGQIMGQSKGQEKQPPERVVDDGRDSKRDTEWDSGGTVAGQWRDETNKDNKGNKENNDLGAEAPASVTPKNLYQSFVDLYFDFFKKRMDGTAPKFEAKHGSAMKSIIKYLKNSVEARSRVAGIELTEEQAEHQAKTSFAYILDNWDLLDDFSQNQLDICSMNSQFNRIITQLKKKSNGTQAHLGGTGKNGVAKPGTSEARIEAAKKW